MVDAICWTTSQSDCKEAGIREVPRMLHVNVGCIKKIYTVAEEAKSCRERAVAGRRSTRGDK
jgi:hypothetical protein